MLANRLSDAFTPRKPAISFRSPHLARPNGALHYRRNVRGCRYWHGLVSYTEDLARSLALDEKNQSKLAPWQGVRSPWAALWVFRSATGTRGAERDATRGFFVL